MKSLSSSYINQSNINKDTFYIKNINHSSIGESVNNFIFNINDNISHKENLENFLFNFANIKTINSEKIKVQKKLEEYRKLIDKKLNQLRRYRSNRQNNTNTNKNEAVTIRLKLFDKEGKSISHGNNCETVYDKVKRKIICISNKSHRSINRKKFKIA